MRILGLLLLCLFQFSCVSQVTQKINGVSFVASRKEAAQEHIDEVLLVNANHAAIMPFGFIRDINSPEIIHNTERQWFGETKAGAKQYIEQLHKNGVQVMVKPQIWISNGVFTGTLTMKSEEKWEALEKSYDDFILTYAELAEETNAELLCIGTELEQFVKHRPEYWKRVIQKIRKIYNGKLTYAANWDEYPKTTFWDELDYVGIDTYFPLVESKTPTIEELKKAWKPTVKELRKFYQKTGKPIVFTEYGYMSIDGCAHKNWELENQRTEIPINQQAQANAIEALFEVFWKEDWWGGGFLWKWYPNYRGEGQGRRARFRAADYTPQGKIAEEVLKDWFKGEKSK